MPVLSFDKVTKSFGSIVALDDVSFMVDEGEFLFVTGPSGAGKTTLLRLLIREYAPTSGQIVYNEMQIDTLRRSKVPALRRSIGSVFQDFKLLNDRTVTENARVVLAVTGVPKDEWATRIDNGLELVGLSKRADLFPSQLSGGELQRAALARALVTNPKLIFADEPTGNLDWDTASGVMDLLVKINKEGKTVIVTTHHKTLIEKNPDIRVIELNEGKLVKDTKPKSKKKKEKEPKEESK